MAPPEETKSTSPEAPLPTPDIAGTQAHALDGWEERTERLAKPEFFKVSIHPSIRLLKELDNSQKIRLFKKLKLVIEAAQYMAAGMVKGTVKYATDDYDLKQWFAHLIGEGADQMNYQMLLYGAWHTLHRAEVEAAKGIIGQAVEIAAGEDGNYVVEQDGKVVGGSKFDEEGKGSN